MNTFEDLGKTLDKLLGSENSKFALRLIENFVTPQNVVNFDKEHIKPVEWLNALPKIEYPAVKLIRSNLESIVAWLIESGKFDEVVVVEDGIYTEWGKVIWNEWIVQEDNEVISFYTEETFDELYCLVK